MAINTEDITASNYRDQADPQAAAPPPPNRPAPMQGLLGSMFGGGTQPTTSKVTAASNTPYPLGGLVGDTFTAGATQPPAPGPVTQAANPDFSTNTANEQPGANSGMSRMTVSAAAAPRQSSFSNADVPANQVNQPQGNTVQLGDPLGDARRASEAALAQQADINAAKNKGAFNASMAASQSEDIAKNEFDRASISNPKARREALATYLAARGANAASGAALNTAGTPIADAVATQGVVSNAREQALKGAVGQQGLVEGAQKIQGGEVELKNRQLLQKSMDALHNAKTPDEQNAARQNLLIMQGKNPAEWKAVPVGAKLVTNPDGTTTSVGGWALLHNTITGEYQEVGKPASQEGSEAGYGNHPNNSTATDKAGNVYTITNGKPVLTKKAS